MNKIPLMLVDDDDLMLQNLMVMIDWDEQGFKIVCTASNGKKALSLFEQHLPPFVITDISMPLMDGLDLTDCILKIRPDTYILILTSYKDFGYAQRAMRSGVKDYILKDELTPTALAKKLTHVYSQLLTEDGEASRSKQAILREYFQMADSQILPKSLKVLNEQKLFYILLSPVLPLTAAIEHTESVRLGKDLYQAVKAIDKITYRVPVLFYSDNLVVMGIVPNQPKDNSGYYLCRLIRQMELYLGDVMPERLSAFFSGKPQTLDELGNEMRLLRPLIDFYTRVPAKEPLELGVLKRQSVIKTPQAFSFWKLSGQVMKSDYLKQLLREHVQSILNNRDIKGLAMFHIEACSYYKSLSENRLSFQDRYYYRDLEDYVSFLADTYAKNLDAMQAAGKVHCSVPVKKAMSYIERYYSNSNLTIEKIAQQAGFSAGRLSVLFKQETGRTVNEFLTDVRIEAAVHLLENSSCKIYEIAEMVGYKTSQYFSQVFFQKTRRRPIDYRKSQS